MGAGRAGWAGNALGSLVVVAIVGFTAVGLPLVDRQLPAGRPINAAVPYYVGAGVTITPPEGSSLDVTKTRPGDDRGTALFVISAVRLVVVVGPFHGNTSDAVRRLRAKITKPAGYQVAGPAHSVVSDQGVDGLLGQYHSVGKIGHYAVFVSADQAVEVTTSGPENDLRQRWPSLERSVHSVAFVGGG